jgi:hypothetical protein
VTKRQTQNERVLYYLRRARRYYNGGVSALELLSWAGVYRAGARIYDLRKLGYSIRTVRRPDKTAVYFLEGEPK